MECVTWSEDQSGACPNCEVEENYIEEKKRKKKNIEITGRRE